MKRYTIFTLLFIIWTNSVCSSVIILNGLTHTHNAVPGEMIQGEIVIMNTSDSEQRITFRLNDVIFSCGNSRVFTADSTHIQSSKSWFRGSLMDRMLLPKEKYTYKYAIDVPATKLDGSFWNALMIEVVNPIKEERLTAKIDLDTKIRYGIGLITNINRIYELEVEFDSVDLAKDESDHNVLIVNLFNPSNYVEGLKLSLEVYNSNGKKVFETTSKRPIVFPNMCMEFSLDLKDLGNGEYECILIADSREEYVGTNLSLTVR